MHLLKGSGLQQMPKTHLPNALQGCIGYTEKNGLLLSAEGWNGNEFRTPGFLSSSRWKRKQDDSLLLEIHGDKLNDCTFLLVYIFKLSLKKRKPGYLIFVMLFAWHIFLTVFFKNTQHSSNTKTHSQYKLLKQNRRRFPCTLSVSPPLLARRWLLLPWTSNKYHFPIFLLRHVKEIRKAVFFSSSSNPSPMTQKLLKIIL